MLCPICKKPVEEAANGNKYFPFCSERCKLIDLGRWLGGRYQIPVRPSDEEDVAAPPPPGRPDDEE